MGVACRRAVGKRGRGLQRVDEELWGERTRKVMRWERLRLDGYGSDGQERNVMGDG